MVGISEHLFTSLHLIFHGLLSLAHGLYYNWILPEALSQPTGTMILCILLPALSLELLLAHILKRVTPAEQLTANLCIGLFCLLSVLLGWSGSRTNKQFHAAKCLRPVTTYIALSILHTENIRGFGLMSMVLYSFGLHLSMYGTNSPKVQGTSYQLFIVGMAADALGLAVIPRLFQGECFGLQSLADSWSSVAPICFALMCALGYLSESCTTFPVSPSMFSICLLNLVVTLTAIYSTLTIIRSFGVITLLFVDDVMHGIMVIASKDHPQSTILWGYLIASCGFVMYHWTKAHARVNRRNHAGRFCNASISN